MRLEGSLGVPRQVTLWTHHYLAWEGDMRTFELPIHQQNHDFRLVSRRLAQPWVTVAWQLVSVVCLEAARAVRKKVVERRIGDGQIWSILSICILEKTAL